jgi:hypothetical protein
MISPLPDINVSDKHQVSLLVANVLSCTAQEGILWGGSHVVQSIGHLIRNITLLLFAFILAFALRQSAIQIGRLLDEHVVLLLLNVIRSDAIQHALNTKEKQSSLTEFMRLDRKLSNLERKNEKNASQRNSFPSLTLGM